MANGERTTVNFGFGQVIANADGTTTVVLPGIGDIATGGGDGTNVNLGEGINISTPAPGSEQRRAPTARSSNQGTSRNAFQNIALDFLGGTFNFDSTGIRTDFLGGNVSVGSSDNFSGPVQTNVNGLNVNALVDQVTQIFGS